MEDKHPASVAATLPGPPPCLPQPQHQPQHPPQTHQPPEPELGSPDYDLQIGIHSDTLILESEKGQQHHGQVAASRDSKETDVESHDLPGVEVLDTDAPPDGGRAAWLVVFGAWCVSFCSYGWINSVGTFQEYYQSGPLKAYSVSTISWIPSLQIFFMSVLGPVIGHVYDRYGMRLLVLVGSLMHVFGLMMASISTEYYQFLLSQGVCSALGVAVVFLSAISAVTGWFHRRRGLAFGVLSTGSSLGGVVFPIMLSRLIDKVGYGWAMRTSAFLIFALLTVANLTLRTRQTPATPSHQPSSLPKNKIWHPFHEPPFLLLLAGLFLVPFGLYLPINYLPVASIASGMPREPAQNLVAYYNAASLLGRFSSGLLSDRAGRFNVFVAACYTAGALILGMWIPARTGSVAIAFAVLFGVFSGAYISLMAALVAQISPLGEVGYRNGLTFLFSSVGGLTTAPIAGAILGTPAGWDGLKVFAGVFMVAGTTFILAARVARVGWEVRVVF
ncbi:MFS general substrate transporter [Coniochaeta hoffmannii]|uniref:MFS general substrate transporter n=1 Tax=Coniochaeta hoffmannii TaxID=91930 RepID=A0AA38RF18_9PEZI|nr:MFS general substrate transporter [Coniochaeta hoffmannii]